MAMFGRRGEKQEEKAKKTLESKGLVDLESDITTQVNTVALSLGD